jgi:hypothetical protein
MFVLPTKVKKAHHRATGFDRDQAKDADCARHSKLIPHTSARNRTDTEP